MSEGSTFKRCKCKDDAGKERGSGCPKLRRKNGSWNPRHGSWYYRLSIRKRGKQKVLRKGGYATQEDAQEGLEKAQASVSRGVAFSRKETLGEYLDRWIEQKKTGSSSSEEIARKTYVSYSGHIRNYISPLIGHIPLAELEVVHVSQMFEEIDDMNGEIIAARGADDPHVRGKRPAGPATKQRIRATLRSALTDARSAGLVSHNVAEDYKMTSRRAKALVWTDPRVARWRRNSEVPSPVMVWRPQHAALFLDHAKKDRLFPLFRLVLLRGLRRGEALALRWSDVRIGQREIDIVRQRVEVEYQVVETTPKTESGMRTVMVDGETERVLHEWRKRQSKERMANGLGASTDDYVFTRSNGEPWHPAAVSKAFQRLVKEADLPPIRFHDLRHLAASVMYAAGDEVKDIQSTLGHSSSGITLDTYTSVFEESARKSAERAADVIHLDEGDTA